MHLFAHISVCGVRNSLQSQSRFNFCVNLDQDLQVKSDAFLVIAYFDDIDEKKIKSFGGK